MGVEKERENVLSCLSSYPSEIYLTINIGGESKTSFSLPSRSFGCQFNLDLMPPWETPRPISPLFSSLDLPGRARQRHKTSRRNARTVKCLRGEGGVARTLTILARTWARYFQIQCIDFCS